MRYSPKAGIPQAYSIGMKPEDKAVWDQVQAAVQRQRDAGAPVLAGNRLSSAVRELVEMAEEQEQVVEHAATNLKVLKHTSNMLEYRIQAMAYLFRVLSKS